MRTLNFFSTSSQEAPILSTAAAYQLLPKRHQYYPYKLFSLLDEPEQPEQHDDSQLTLAEQIAEDPECLMDNLGNAGDHVGTSRGDGHANQGSGLLQPGFRPEPEIVYIWGLNRPDRPPNPFKKVEGFALHLFERVWMPVGPA